MICPFDPVTIMAPPRGPMTDEERHDWELAAFRRKLKLGVDTGIVDSSYLREGSAGVTMALAYLTKELGRAVSSGDDVTPAEWRTVNMAMLGRLMKKVEER